MEPIADPRAANRAIRNYLAHASGQLPDAVFAKLEEYGDSPSLVDQMVNTTEYLYANRTDLDDTGKTIVGQLASFCAANGFWNMGGASNRGGKIYQAMARDLGEAPPAGATWPDEKDDPAPLPQFIEQAQATPPAA